MYKTILTATTVALISTTAQAGLWDVLTGKQTIKELNAEHAEKQIEHYSKKFEKTDDVVLFDSQAVYVEVEGVVTRVPKTELQGTKDNKIAKIKELVGNNVALKDLEESVDTGKITEAEFMEIEAKIEAGAKFEDLKLDADVFKDDLSGLEFDTFEALEDKVLENLETVAESLEEQKDYWDGYDKACSDAAGCKAYQDEHGSASDFGGEK